MFQTLGQCPFGLSCRFGSSHVKFNSETDSYDNLVNEEQRQESSKTTKIFNILDSELKAKLWKKKYDFGQADKIIRVVNDYVYVNRNTVSTMKYNSNKGVMTKKFEEAAPVEEAKPVADDAKNNNNNNNQKKVGPVTDEDLIKLRNCEKKKIDWKNKLYLAPLTTVIRFFIRINSALICQI